MISKGAGYIGYLVGPQYWPWKFVFSLAVAVCAGAFIGLWSLIPLAILAVVLGPWLTSGSHSI
jgi:hypothetical protein